MSAMLKNLHVHFDDDVLSDGAAKKRLDDELANQKKTNAGPILNYSRKKLYEFGQSKACKEAPKIVNLSGADDKRKEKIRYVLKNCDILKSYKNGISDGISKGGVGENNTPNDQVRSNFQQMISAAVTNAQQHNGEYANTNRRRIGSGRIPDNYTAQDNVYAIGMDVRYMRNKLFRDDGKVVKNWKSGLDFNWNNSEMSRHSSDMDNMDAKSDEPEWANCGPISKHDIIELHGFDGPEDDDETHKSESITASPPARNSTPTKLNSKKSTKEEHFNFEDFLKLDLPASVNCSRDFGAGESRFSQWFGRDKPAHSIGKYGGNAFDAKSTQQFFEYHQKTNHKNFNMPNKLRSVNELEADWCPSTNPTKPKEPANQQHQMDANAVRMMLNQLATSAVQQKQRSTMNAAQTNFLLNLINKGAEGIYQYRLSQNATMKRPDAQLLLHRLVNGEITQYHILQQISNPNIHQRDRETLLAVFAFCNENQQWLVQQQEQQLKHKEQMSQQFRQLQMIQMKNGNMQPTPQELQLHTQTIMQNAMYKKQYEDQYRNVHGMKFGNQQNSKFQSYKPNNYMPNQSYNRYNYKQQRQYGQNGLQFIQSQQKSLWNRHNQSYNGVRNTNELFANTMPTFKFDAPSMSMPNEKLSITVEK